MIPIKIECGCGQRYAFDVEGASGTMPYPVACPSCGTDGTDAANQAIAQSAPVAPPPAVHLSAPGMIMPSAAIRRNAANVPQVDKTQVGHEARAKIFWGDPQDEVVKFLMIAGFSAPEAMSMVQSFFAERAQVIRKHGMGKIIVGIPLMCVPVVAYFIFAGMPIFPGRLFAIAMAIGLWGTYLLIKGLIMFISPKSEPGDVADK